MNIRITAAACAALLLVAAPVLADDAGPTDTASDATATSDAGSGADAGSLAGDATSTADAGVQPDTSDGPFSVNPCWDEKCPAEVAACKAAPDCAKLGKCVKDSGKSAGACGEELKLTKEQYDPAASLFNKISTCGWTACADPTKGTCKDRCGTFDDVSPCNCDGLCKDYGDCCADHQAQCPAMFSCKGFCDAKVTNTNSDKLACNCDASCPAGADCCTDYALQCKGTSCTPNCADKQCGPDGCGKTCGSCQAGAQCDFSGKCIGGGSSSGGTDATSSSSGGDGAGSSSGAVTDAGGTDGGSSGGASSGGSSSGTTTTTPTTSSDSGGCSAAPAGSSGSTGFMALILLALGGLWLRRRTLAGL